MYQYEGRISNPPQLMCADSPRRADIGGACANQAGERRRLQRGWQPVIAAPSHKGGCQPASYRDRARKVRCRAKTIRHGRDTGIWRGERDAAAREPSGNSCDEGDEMHLADPNTGRST